MIIEIQSLMSKGFTLIEILLSIAFIAILSGLSIPVYQQLQNSTALDTAAQTAVHALRRAQTLSEANNGDTTWGMRIHSGSLILFKGPSYTGRDASVDESFDLPTTITPSGLQEVIFSKVTGEPQTAGILTLTGVNNHIKTITLNEKGTITY